MMLDCLKGRGGHHTLKLLSAFLFGEKTVHVTVSLLFNNTQSGFDLWNENSVRNELSAKSLSTNPSERAQQTHPRDVHHLFDTQSHGVHLHV